MGIVPRPFWTLQKAIGIVPRRVSTLPIHATSFERRTARHAIASSSGAQLFATVEKPFAWPALAPRTSVLRTTRNRGLIE